MRELVAFSSLLMSKRLEMSILLIAYEISLIKLFFSLLFFTMENLYVVIFSFAIRMDTNRSMIGGKSPVRVDRMIIELTRSATKKY